MNLIVDANIVISSLIATKGKTFELMFNDNFYLIAPDFIFQEIEKYKLEILNKSGLNEEELNLFLSLISSRINIVPSEEFEEFMLEADKLSPDPKDSQYFALALKFNCDIWSNDKRIKQQKEVKIHSTQDLLNSIQ